VTVSEDASTRRQIERAIRAVRREGRKVALVYAAVDAAAVAVVLNLAFTVFDARILGPFAVPSVVPRLISLVTRTTVTDVALSGDAVVAAAAGLLVGLVEFGYRSSRPLVEQFEAANPELREALRTARDAVEDGDETRMALRLYEDVLARLRSASSVGLLDLRRLSATLVLVAAVSLVGVQAAVVDLDLAGFGDRGGSGGDDTREPSYAGLKDADGVLGDAEDVSSGDVDVDAPVSTGGDGTGGGETAGQQYDTGGLPSSAVESQQAGYAPPEELEDAELIREYNLKIRENATNG
jgi:hypothetical protein